MMPSREDAFLADAEQDVRDLEQHVADQHLRVEELHAAGRAEDEMKAREGLFLLTDALDIAKGRLRSEREARGLRARDHLTNVQ